MKLTPKDILADLTARLNDTDRDTVSRLVADFLALSARSAAGEDVRTELELAKAALENVQAGAGAGAARMLGNFLVRLAAAAT